MFHSADEDSADRRSFPASSHPYGQFSQATDLPEVNASHDHTVPHQSVVSPYAGSGDWRPDGYRDQLPEYSRLPHEGEVTLDRQDPTQRSPPVLLRRPTSHRAAGQDTENRDVTPVRPPGYFQAVAARLAARNAHTVAREEGRDVLPTRPPSYFRTVAARLAAQNAQAAALSLSTRSDASTTSASPAAVAAARHASSAASEAQGTRRLNVTSEGRAAPRQQERPAEDLIRDLNDRNQDRSRLRSR